MKHISMSATGRNIAYLALLAGAYASNPDEYSFRAHLQRNMDKKIKVAEVKGRTSQPLPSTEVIRRNFYLFSVVRQPIEHSAHVGFFGNWIHIPRWPHPKHPVPEPPE